ncbi:MAG: peptidase C13, partial [Sphingomonadales bacterium]
MRAWWRWAGLVAIGIVTTASAQIAGPGVPAPFAAMDDPLTRGLSAPDRAQFEKAAATDLRRLDATAARLQPQRPGVVDAYVISIALDSDPVFGREAREAGRVLARRYDAEGRTLVLAGPDGRAIDPLPRGTQATLGAALARVAAVIDKHEDALILYVTAHGTPQGIVWRNRGDILATITPGALENQLRRLGLSNRLLILSACFSGIFAPVLASPEGAVITAAAADRTSFGCAADNDWTFFGDALINHALRKPQPLAAAFVEARGTVAG